MNRETFIDGDKTILNTDYYLYLLSCEKENTNLNQKLNKLKDKLLCYGETFDSDIHKQFQKECLEIIDKVGGNE